MGTKRGPSPVLSGVEVQENKKPNLEHGSVNLDDVITSGSNQGATGSETQNGETGSHERVTEDSQDITKIKADLKKLKLITIKQKDEIREGIMAITNKLGEMFIAHSATATSANFYGDFIEGISSRLTDSELREKASDKKIDGIILSNQKTLAKINTVEREVNENTQERKSGNLVLNGVPEKENEDCLVTATTYLTNIDPKFDKIQLLNAHRLGRNGGSASKYRTLLVKFKDVTVKEEIVKKKAILKNKKGDQ